MYCRFFSDRFFQKTVGADRYQRYRYSKQKEKPFDGSGDICILANIGCIREKTVSRVVRKPDGDCFAGMEKWFFPGKGFRDDRSVLNQMRQSSGNLIQENGSAQPGIDMHTDVCVPGTVVLRRTGIVNLALCIGKRAERCFLL